MGREGTRFMGRRGEEVFRFGRRERTVAIASRPLRPIRRRQFPLAPSLWRVEVQGPNWINTRFGVRPLARNTMIGARS
jgi:hypothetical protein